MANVGQRIVAPANLPTPPPATIAGNGNWNSGAFTSGGYPGLAVAATLSVTGTLTVQRYFDPAGTIPIGAAVQQALIAATPGYVWIRDGTPFASFSIVVANSTGGVGNLSGVYILQSIQ